MTDHSSAISDEGDIQMWEHGDESNASFDMDMNSSIDSPPPIGLNITLSSLEVASQELPRVSTPSKRGRPRKIKHFFGNRYTTAKKSLAATQDSPRPRKKIALSLPKQGYTSSIVTPLKRYQHPVEFQTPEGKLSKDAPTPSGMRLLDVGILAEAMTKIKCSDCDGYMHLHEQSGRHGWQTAFFIKCNKCHNLVAQFPSSRPMDVPQQTKFVNIHHPEREMNEVTMRSILAVHSAGFTWRDLHVFATVFDMPAPLGNMPQRYLDRVETTVTEAADISMKEAGQELRYNVDAVPSPISNCTNIAVSFDTSWKTRGFYSNIGFGAAISATSKKVLDFVLLNRICEKCARWTVERQEAEPDKYQRWYEQHKSDCNINYEGYSQSMDPEAAKIIWGRSIQKHQLVYSTFIGDGDSKSYQQVTELDPYPGVQVFKEECLAHVAKRLKKHLMTIETSTKHNTYMQHKLAPAKAEYVTSNYSMVVLQNKGQGAAILAKAMEVLVAHVGGDHSTCPDQPASWCRWRAPGKQPPNKSTNLTANDVAKVQEVFRVFATEEFLKHLTMGKTQNANESLHGTIWNFCPKSKYVSPQSVRISTNIAIANFNEGQLVLYKMLSDLKLRPSYHAYAAIIQRESTKRTKSANKSREYSQRRARRANIVKVKRKQGLATRGGGYRSGAYGAEKFSKATSITRPPRGRKPTAIANKERGQKRRLSSRDDTTDSSLESSSHSDISGVSSGGSGGEELDTVCTVCDICECSVPPSVRNRRVGGKDSVSWVVCCQCQRRNHIFCIDRKIGELDSEEYTCYRCMK